MHEISVSYYLQTMEEESTTSHLGLGGAILAYRFINKSKKSLRRDINKNLGEAEGANIQKALNARQAIFAMNERAEMIQNFVGGNKSKNWDLIKKKITSAKITDALTVPKYEVNGKKVTVLRFLGEGGYSQVYEVYDKEKNMFALKVVDLSVQTEKTKQDLIREILFLEKLRNCRFVVKAFDYQILETETENKMFVLMEKGEKDLHQILSTHRDAGTLSPTRLRFYWEQMLLAVKDVHDNNMIHADIKPGNFLLVAGELKIIDFGMAMEISPGQDYVLRKFMGGTREYMSPELYAGYIIENGEIDREAMSSRQGVKFSPKCDIWALGIILYQIIYHSTPFSSVPGGRLGKIKAIGSPDHPVEFDDVENLDPELLDTMKRCLDKNPEKRATVEELLNHPYLRPKHVVYEEPQVCFSCRKTKVAMARIAHRRLKNNKADLLC